MAEPNWGLLEKSQVDDETIEEAIDRLVAAHNDDADAHIGAGKSLDTHKTQETIDHPANSVKTDKVEDEEITNPKIDKLARAFHAIVDAAGNGDYTDIQSAINYVNGLGGGRIFIKAGTYTPAATLTLYSNIELIGEDKDTTILDFNTKTFDGLTITGTAETNIANVKISELTIKNVTVTSGKFGIYIEYAENITIDSCYFTNNRTEGVASYRGDINIADDVSDRNTEDIIISNCISKNSGRFVSGTGTQRISVENNYVDSNEDNAVKLVNCTDVIVTFNRLLNLGVSGVLITYQDAEATAGRVIVKGNIITDAGNNGIGIGAAGGEIAERIIVVDNIVIDSFNSGIDLDDTTHCTIIGNVIEGSTNAHGIRLAVSDNNIIINNVCTGASGYGISILDAASDKNIVLGNHLLGNTTGALQDNGIDTEVGHNIAA